MSDYKSYPVGTRVKIKSTSEYGEAFESLWGFVSVFLDNDKSGHYEMYNIKDVKFIEENENN